jgi:two-component system response regulator AtoC
VLFGRSEIMSEVRQRAERVSRSELPVLICGAPGTGKSTLAYWIHRQSGRALNPYVSVNCAAMPASLLESELFGYQRGAFTGAHADKPGRIEQANQGTLFLEGIAELELGLQAKLLQFLQDGTFMRLGDQFERKIDARVICAAKADLRLEAENGRFRRDLFYRINVVQIQMPPLSARRTDVPLLVDYFLSEYNRRFERNAPEVAHGLKKYLENLEWRGNIRELENRVARYVILGSEDALDLEGEQNKPRAKWPATTGLSEPGPIPLKKMTKEVIRQRERDVILQILRENQWNRRKTARALRISYRALIYKINEAGLSTKRRNANRTIPQQEKLGPGGLPDA